jgi:hypothetical protein
MYAGAGLCSRSCQRRIEKMPRERILCFGGAGCGKTFAWLTIASNYPSHRFHVIDTDDTCDRMLTTEFNQLRNVQVYSCQDWLSCTKALDTIKTKVVAGDWLVIDQVCSCWSMVQNYFISEIFRQDAGDYFLEIRKAMKANSSSLNALRGWVDWSVINRMFEDFINLACYQLPCNVFFTAKATKLSKEDDQEVQDVYSMYGLRPEGEKRVPFRVHSVFLFTHDRRGYYLSTIKDRGRIQLSNVPLTPEQNFCIRYLQLVAGMELEK